MKAYIGPRGHRGFFSVYTCTLVTIHQLIHRFNHSQDDFYFSNDLFTLYGPLNHWFDVKKIKRACPSDAKPYFDTWAYDHGFIRMKPWISDEEMDRFKYVNLFPYNQRVKDLIESELLNTKECVGIHYRGTDGWVHVDRIDIDEYVEEAKKEMKRLNTDSIFLCTDEVNIIEKFEDKLPEANITYHNTMKANTDHGLHFKSMSKKRKMRMGDEVILDSFALSNCKSVICKTSNLITHARILNPKLNVIYLEKKLKLTVRFLGKYEHEEN